MGLGVHFYNRCIVKHVRKSVLLWYSPREMYDLVTAVAAYPDFLPWCDRAELIAQHDDGVTARLGMAFGVVRHSFTTRNRQRPDESVRMSLVDGPFSRLDGGWRFRPLSDAQACKVEFELRYEFANTAFEAVLSPVFDKAAGSFVDSFVRRAEQVYGAR